MMIPKLPTKKDMRRFAVGLILVGSTACATAGAGSRPLGGTFNLKAATAASWQGAFQRCAQKSNLSPRGFENDGENIKGQVSGKHGTTRISARIINANAKGVEVFPQTRGPLQPAERMRLIRCMQRATHRAANFARHHGAPKL